MIQYFENKKIACVDDHCFVRDERTGYYLSSQKIDGKRVRLHAYIWRKANGEIPKGMHIHHKDGDKSNNELENLVMLTAKEHSKIHAENYSEERLQAMRDNVVKNAMPKAKEWHGTDEGKRFHSEHAKEMWKNRSETEQCCTYCGEIFKTRKAYSENENRFCSNKCKAAFRRKSGVDNVKKICENCGGTYIANKYAKTKYCESCKNTLHRSRRRRTGV